MMRNRAQRVSAPAPPLGGTPHVREHHLINSWKLKFSVSATSKLKFKGTVELHFQMRSFLVLASTSAPIKQAGNRAILPFSVSNWPHRKAPLRGARVR